jgi:hypothetical protein
MSEKEFKIKELERLFSEHMITLDQYLDARTMIEKGQVPLTEPQQFSTPQNYSTPQPRTLQPTGPRGSYKKIIIGVILALIIFASGFFVWGYFNPANAEALTIESYSVKASKGAVVLRLKNTGNTNIQITDVKMNGYSYQSLPPMFQEGWNGTTFLQPQQAGLLYVYVFTYSYALSSSIPHLSSPPTETELDNFFTWMDSYDTTFTLVTSTQRQYDVKANTSTVWLTMVWMSSLTFTFMKTEELKITSMTFGGSSGVANNTIVLSIRNSGTSKVTVSEVRVNDVGKTFGGTLVYDAGASGTITIYMGTSSWTTGNKYKVSLLSASGTTVAAYETTA